jgi:hypothetical protein
MSVDGKCDNKVRCLRDTFERRLITASSITTPITGASTKMQTNIETSAAQPQAAAHLPVGEGAYHPDGAVRPIENSGRRVGQGETARRYGVYARRSQAADGEDDEFMHRGRTSVTESLAAAAAVWSAGRHSWGCSSKWTAWAG